MMPLAGNKEAFSPVVIDVQIKDVGWDLTGSQSECYEYQLPDGTFTDYVLVRGWSRPRQSEYAGQRETLY